MEDKKQISSFLPFYALPLMAGSFQSNPNFYYRKKDVDPLFDKKVAKNRKKNKAARQARKRNRK